MKDQSLSEATRLAALTANSAQRPLPVAMPAKSGDGHELGLCFVYFFQNKKNETFTHFISFSSPSDSQQRQLGIDQVVRQAHPSQSAPQPQRGTRMALLC